MQGSQTLGKTKKKTGSQRHSAGNIDYDNISGSQDEVDMHEAQSHALPTQPQMLTSTFRGRSKTLGDATDGLPTQPAKLMTIQQPQQIHQVHHQIQYQQMQQKAEIIERMDPGTKSEGEDDSQHGSLLASVTATGTKPKATLGRTPNHLTLSTTSTLSVGSTGSQARLIQSSHPPSNYQPMLMKDLGKINSKSQENADENGYEQNVNSTIMEDYSSETDLRAASTAAACNLSIGTSGSLFSSSSSSGGGGGGENDMQTTNYRKKRLSPRQSPKQDIEVIEIFASELELSSLNAKQRVSIVHKDSSSSSSSSSSSNSKSHKLNQLHAEKSRDIETDIETDTEERSQDNDNDNDNSSLDMALEHHARFMDKHLSDLEHGGFIHETGCDILAYMANLKEQTLESLDLQQEQQDIQQNDSSLSPEPQTVVENTQQVVVVADIETEPRPQIDETFDTLTTTTGASERSEDESDPPCSSLAQRIVIIDKKLDKSNKNKAIDKHGYKSASSNGNTSTSSSGSVSHKPKIKHISPERASKSQGSSPVRIIKIKSPRSSFADHNKRSGGSRDSSQDRLSCGARTPSPRRASEGGGILKRSASPNGSILKPSSPNKSKSPDRSCLKKLSVGHDCSIESLSPHLSPRDSIERLSPVCARHTSRNSFEAARNYEPNFMYKSRSPERGRSINRKRSLSTQASFESGYRLPTEPYYQYFPIYDNQTCSDHYVTANLRREDSNSSASYGARQRLSKSLERSTSRESSGSSYHYVHSPEHSYFIPCPQSLEGPMRSQSAENAFSRAAYELSQEMYDINSTSYQYQRKAHTYQYEPTCTHERANFYYSSSAPEHTTCMDCLYKKKPS